MSADESPIGNTTCGPTYLLTRTLFLRTLAVIYLIATGSLWVQFDGLVGPDGISPVKQILNHLSEQDFAFAIWRFPTLFWISAAPWMGHALCTAGVMAAMLLFAGILQGPMLAVMWGSYLSLTVAGQVFFSFQWDTLLLETCFMAMFWAPWRWRTGGPASGTGLWLLRGLLFKLMFLSGITKLLSGDVPWHEGTALLYHFETQPLPNWLAWHAHQVSPFWQGISMWAMYFIEIVVPLAIVGPRWMRVPAFLALVTLQLLIMSTGSYCFFNLLTIALCLPLLDDTVWRRIAPWLRRRPIPAPLRKTRSGWRLAYAALTAAITLISVIAFTEEMVATDRNRRRAFEAELERKPLPAAVVTALSTADRYLLKWMRPLALDWSRPFRTINGYGLFRTMTTKRPEIEIEGSHDGQTWIAYRFRWKPGPLDRRPRYAVPHQPRLDWQMWFAALDPRRASSWLQSLAIRLLEGSPAVLRLFEDNPFPFTPPRYIRFVYYEYRFTRRGDDAPYGHWWQRRLLGNSQSLHQSNLDHP